MPARSSRSGVPSHRPQWVQVSPGPGDRGGAIDYCRLADEASIVWAANLAALELHAPMARGVDIETPTMVVFDLDPGAPADINDCAEVGLWIRDVLDGLGLQCFAKTSGSKGLQVYVPVNRPPLTHEQASGFALAVAQAMEKHHGDRVLSNMRKELRKGKVFIDWSQNSRHKTTICAYSLRARPRADRLDAGHVGRSRCGGRRRTLVVRGAGRARPRRRGR